MAERKALAARTLRDKDYLKSNFGEICPLPVWGQPRRLSQLIQFSFLKRWRNPTKLLILLGFTLFNPT